jgi:Asp-tRNA(Asn)/Glu-tRNA(Gln) amidotransferase A subunit family amidase
MQGSQRTPRIQVKFTLGGLGVPLSATVALAGLIVVAHGQTAVPRFDVVEKSVAELAAALNARTVTSRQLTAEYLARIDAYDQRGPSLNSMIVVNPRALDEAAALDRERASRGARGPLHGIPLVIKDNYETIDLPTTAGSIALKGLITGRDAFQVRKLRDAGVVIVGKTNLHEFARGITTISSLGGQTRNPYDPTRNPGGSSGGTGAAVAANFAAAGMGSDTCGSIRYPSAHNSLVGLRPTQGLSSRTGIIPLSHSQDVGGPLAKTVRDVALLMDATVGPDPEDPTTRAGIGKYPVGGSSYVKTLDGASLQGARLGTFGVLFGDAPEDQRAGSVVRIAIEEMTAAGALFSPIAVEDPPKEADGVAIIRHEFKFDLDAYFAKTPKAPVRSLAEVLEKHLHHPSLENAFRTSADVPTLDSDAYRAIVARNAGLRQVLIDVMDRAGVVALVYPTLRRTASKIGEPQAGGNCAASAATGLPAITVPAGFADDGMPVGIEFLGRPFSEVDLLKLAFAYERTTHHRRPPALLPALNRD